MEDETTTKSMTLRLDKDLAEKVQALAEIESMPIAQIVREAISSHVVARSKEPDFQVLLKARIEKQARLTQLFQSE